MWLLCALSVTAQAGVSPPHLIFIMAGAIAFLAAARASLSALLHEFNIPTESETIVELP